MDNKNKKLLKDIWGNILNSYDVEYFQEIEKIIRVTGRNDPCWCDSGKKYKNCHLNRSQETPLRIHEYIKFVRKLFDKGYCHHPNADSTTCIGPIIKAHTLQRNGSLNQIARDGHVYTFSSEKNLFDDQVVAPILIGVKEASTFTGFCQGHDNSIFEPIERHPFQSTPQQTFLLGYRALCHELFKKKTAIERIFPYQHEHLDKGKSLLDQIMVQYELRHDKETNIIALGDLEHYKKAYDQALYTANFSDIFYYVVHLNNVPDVLCTALLTPDSDFNGEILQDIYDISIVVDHFIFSLIATGSRGAAVFSWLGKSEAAEHFVRSLHALSDHELPHAIVRFTFEYFENIFASPTWWEGLNYTAQQALLQRQRSGFPSSPERSSYCLVDDGLRVVNWGVISRETNLRI